MTQASGPADATCVDAATASSAKQTAGPVLAADMASGGGASGGGFAGGRNLVERAEAEKGTPLVIECTAVASADGACFDASHAACGGGS